LAKYSVVSYFVPSSFCSTLTPSLSSQVMGLYLFYSMNALHCHPHIRTMIVICSCLGDGLLVCCCHSEMSFFMFTLNDSSNTTIE